MVRHGPAKGRRAVPGRLVAPIAIRVRGREVVIAAYVAIRAGYDFARRRHLVRARQSPPGHGVIKRYVRPQRRVVAVLAIGRPKRRSRRGVRWIIGLLPRRQMASRIPAIRRLNRQRLIVHSMALVASRNLAGRGKLMRIRQRETGFGVVERRIRP